MSFAAVAGATVSVVGSSLLNADNNKASRRASNAAADATALNAQIAGEQWQRYKDIYSPLEDKFVTDAQNYDTPTRYQQAAGDASATVSSQFAKARERLNRTPGLDPSSPAYTASLAGLDLAQAATDATQQNAARKNVTDTAYARKTDALSLGKGLPAQATTGAYAAARNNMGLADMANAQGMYNSQAFGNVVNRVINPTTMKAAGDWLTATNDLKGNGGWGTGNAFGNQDYGLSI
jgi:hypothetical protein